LLLGCTYINISYLIILDKQIIVNKNFQQPIKDNKVSNSYEDSILVTDWQIEWSRKKLGFFKGPTALLHFLQAVRDGVECNATILGSRYKLPVPHVAEFILKLKETL
jgi:hypothetical protein